MKAILQLYIKVFLFMGIGFALAIMLIDIAFHDWDGLLEYLIKGIIFGLFMSVVMVTGHWQSLKGLGIQTFTKEILGVRHQKAIQSSITPSEFLNRIKENPDIKSAKIKDTGHGWEVRTGTNWKGWGDVIEIQYSSAENKLFEYSIFSKPLLLTTMIDSGSNYQNILRFEKMLQADSSR